MSTPKLTRVTRLDSIRLDSDDKTYFTEEGYLVDHPVLTSCGIFEYKNPDGSTRRELRLPEHVFAEKSLESYRGKPVIITHDAGEISKDNVGEEQIGTIMSDGYRDGNDVRAEILIHDTDSMKKSGLKELSLGYNLDLIEEPGEYNGEPYDAIQTNIIINHLALVASARAGEQARLNIDGSDKEQALKGGRLMANINIDGETLTPEELKQAIADFKAKKEAKPDSVETKPEPAPETEPVPKEEDGNVPAEEQPTESEPDEITKDGSSPADIAAEVAKRKEERAEKGIPTKEEEVKDAFDSAEADIDMLLAALDKLLGEKEEEKAEDCGGKDCGVKKDEEGDESFEGDSSDDESKSLNNDSVDSIIRDRLALCRLGDRLHMDGLEKMSLTEGKKAIIKKVLPQMRLDGKGAAYIEAAYDMAVSEASRKKTADDQRIEMASGGIRERKARLDGKNKGSQAAEARNRMIAREAREEGGNE